MYATVADGIHSCACLNPVVLAFAKHLIALSNQVSLDPSVRSSCMY